MTVLKERKGIRLQRDEFVFDKPQKQKSKIVRCILEFIEDIELNNKISLSDSYIETVRKTLYKELDILHLMVLNNND